MVIYTSFISTIKKEKEKYVVPIPLDYTHKSLTPRLAFLHLFFFLDFEKLENIHMQSTDKFV